MAANAPNAWRDHALAELERAGYRSGAARLAVVDLLARQQCCLTAREISDQLRQDGTTVGIASVYRALEALDDLRLVQRLDAGEGVARFEAADPSGEHHHHVVCDRCGTVAPFEDAALERAIERVAARLDYEVAGHDVVLHGTCAECRSHR